MGIVMNMSFCNHGDPYPIGEAIPCPIITPDYKNIQIPALIKYELRSGLTKIDFFQDSEGSDLEKKVCNNPSLYFGFLSVLRKNMGISGLRICADYPIAEDRSNGMLFWRDGGSQLIKFNSFKRHFQQLDYVLDIFPKDLLSIKDKIEVQVRHKSTIIVIIYFIGDQKETINDCKQDILKIEKELELV